ncbi:MAG: hypothetical protein LC754_13455 [Acidobacteria bacterium]|nr:hypothetical protein [Acidobacteriota bacterium]
MIIKISIALMLCLVFFANSCESKSGGQNSAPSSNTQQTASNAPAANVSGANAAEQATPAANSAASNEAPVVAGPDICSLIDKSEIAAVQGAQVQSVVPSSQMSGALAISQCYYTVISADGSKNLSVHLQVMRGDAKAAGRNAAKDFWEEKFKHEKDRGEEEEETGQPLPIKGVGDEAFWMGNDRVGALYALKGDKIVRVSVGGPDDGKVKIEKSKTLARKTLQRLK